MAAFHYFVLALGMAVCAKAARFPWEHVLSVPHRTQSHVFKNGTGCSSVSDAAKWWNYSTLMPQTIELDEEDVVPELYDPLNPVVRTYQLYVPRSYAPGIPIPLMFVFHGWGETGKMYAERYTMEELAETHGFIGVFPDGYNGCTDRDCGPTPNSWNGVGTTSSTNGDDATCDPTQLHEKTCYESCKKRKGECHPCDWTHCHDDALFIKKLMAKLQTQFCVSEEKIVGYGCSNGGVVLHQLIRDLPGVFSAIVPTCGAKPMKGFAPIPQGPPIPILMVVGDQDHRIPRHPPNKSMTWWDGYIYSDEQEVIDAYVKHNGCRNRRPRKYKTEIDGNNMTCTEHGFKCLNKVNVVQCVFSGVHDINTNLGSNHLQDDPELAVRFLMKAIRKKALFTGDISPSGGALGNTVQ